MSNLCENTEKEQHSLNALNKERWIGFLVRYDEFWKFVYEFIIPTADKLQEEEAAAQSYFQVEFPMENIIQICFLTNPLKLENQLKPIFFERLQQYYTDDFLKALGVEKIDESILAKKKGYDGFDFQNFKLLGLQEYYIDTMTYVMGNHASQVLMNFMTASTSMVFSHYRSEEKEWSVEDSVEKALFIHVSLLHTFMKNREEMYFFLAWATNSMMSNIKKLGGVVDLLDWKFRALWSMEANFESSQETMMGYTQYVLESLDQQDEFEEDWCNQWVQSCQSCKRRIDELVVDHKILNRQDQLEQDMSLFHEIDDNTYMNWQIVFWCIRNINSQLGMADNYILEIDLLYSLKKSLMIITGYDKKNLEDQETPN